jgi:hypothetical protein
MSIDETSSVDASTNRRRLLAGPGIVGLVSLLAVLTSLDPADCRPELPQGPGVTLDETFNIQMGVFFTEAVRTYGVALLSPSSLCEVFSTPGYNPDHPPLARLWLGVFHDLVQSIAPPEDVPGQPGSPLATVTVSARTGSAVAFALTVFLVGIFTAHGYGAFAGTAAAASLVMMPRVFGHAHLAALETVTGLFYTAAVLVTAHLWSRDTVPSDRAAAFTGLLIGLTFLCKMQAVLLPPLLTVWAFWHWRLFAFRPLVIAGAITVTVFIVGWPWLWLDFPSNLINYFSSATNRTELHCWYFGKQFVDKDVPWHYPWVMSVVTVPIGVLAFGLVGTSCSLSRLLSNRRLTLPLGAIVAPLVLFSLPGIAVYDGVRLFLVAFPSAAVFCGIGAEFVRKRLTQRDSARRSLLLTSTVLVFQAVGIVQFSPYWLSYYSLATGTLSGAESVGLEVSYWSDSMSREFLTEVVKTVPPGSTIEVTPVMHPSQPREMLRQSPLLRRHELTLIAYGSKPVHSEYLVTFRRRADVLTPAELESKGWSELQSLSHSGVKLATLWQRVPVR